MIVSNRNVFMKEEVKFYHSFKQTKLYLRLFELIILDRKSSKKKKLNVVQIDKTEAVIGLKAGIFSVRDRVNGRSHLWQSYQEVLNENKELTNLVQCRQCKRIDKYDSGKGLKMLGDHAKLCGALGNSRMDLFVEKKHIEITKEEKKCLAERTAEFCYRDMRPFSAINGAGLMQLLIAISAITAKYGRFSDDQLKKILPCANTVGFK